MYEQCERCGRKLKNPLYQSVGYGKVCAAKAGVDIPRPEPKSKPKKEAAK